MFMIQKNLVLQYEQHLSTIKSSLVIMLCDDITVGNIANLLTSRILYSISNDQRLADHT